ncbi:MAG: hypothetical protein WBV94_34920 [Blastocatellia bacterium]
MDEITAKIHDLLSSKALIPLMHLQQVVRPNRHSFMFAYREGCRFRRAASGWSAEQKREWILARLRFTVRRAYSETFYYREQFDRIGFDPRTDFSFKDFAQLPVLEREDVSVAGRALVSNAVPAAQLRKNATGGSTGMPTEIWMGPEEQAWSESGREHFMRQIGLPPGTRTGMLWGHHLDPVASDRFFDRFVAFTNNTLWLDCFRLSPEALESCHERFERFRPVCIIAYASALGHLAEHILERGHKPGYPTKCFITGAEKLLPAHREMIEQAFSRPVHERYGSRDIGSMGFQPDPARSLDYATDWANVLIEPETEEQDSSILVTKLHADGMPMIRYRVGDTGSFLQDSRAGHPSFVIREVLGRTTDRIWLPNGQWINGIQMPHMMKDHPVREFMFIQHADYSIQLKIAPKDGFGEESRRKIRDTIKSNLPGLDVNIEVVNEIPRTRANKWRPVISEISAARQGAL